MVGIPMDGHLLVAIDSILHHLPLCILHIQCVVKSMHIIMTVDGEADFSL